MASAIKGRETRCVASRTVHLVDITVGVTAALIASILWMVALPPLVGPRLAIAERIVQYTSRAPDDRGKLAYRITVHNRRRRSVIDLRYELTLRYFIGEGKPQLRILLRENNGPLSVSGRSGVDDGAYGLSFHLDLLHELRSVSNLPEFNRCEIRVRVFVRDEMSGVGKNFTRIYRPQDIVLIPKHSAPGELAAVLPMQPSGDTAPDETSA